MQHKSSDEVSSFAVFFNQMRTTHPVVFLLMPTKSASARGTEPWSPILV